MPSGITSKRRLSANGKAWGGRPVTAGALYQMLQNPIYCGRIGHKGQDYEGVELWAAVQQSLADKRRERRSCAKARAPSLLAGLIVDVEGKRLTPSHAVKGGKRYRYYVSRSLITDPGRACEPSWRLPAVELEPLVVKQIGEFLADQKSNLNFWARKDDRGSQSTFSVTADIP